MKTLPNVVLRGIVSSVAALTLVAAPSIASAQEPTLASVELDPTAVPPEGTRTRLLLTGAALTVGWYGASLGSSFLWQDAPTGSDWRIPVAGPWMALSQVKCGVEESNCNTPILVLRTALTLISSIGQIGGLLALTEGLLLNSTPPSALTAPAVSLSDPNQSSFQWLPLPLANPNGFGLGILGRF